MGAWWDCSAWSSGLVFCSAWQLLGLCPILIGVSMWSKLIIGTGLDTYLATAHFVVWDCLMFGVLLELELWLSWCSARSGTTPGSVRHSSARSSYNAGWSWVLWGGHWGSARFSSHGSAALAGQGSDCLLFCSAWVCSAWSSSQGPSAWAGQGSARFASLLFFTGTARVVSSLLPSGSMWHCSAWSTSLHFCSAWPSGGVVGVVCPTMSLVNNGVILGFRTGLDTYLATAHCIVWGCLMFWVQLELELVMLWCSAWSLLRAASWSVRQGSARSLCTSGGFCILCGGKCRSGLGSVCGGHCSARASASILRWGSSC